MGKTVKRIINVLCIMAMVVHVFCCGVITAYGAEEKPQMTLNALAACLIDAENGRVLYEKNGYEERAMASTTKIMSLIIALENGKEDDIVTVSKNAAIQPDVQLNINTGEQYRLGDLYYSLMLESHNDTAVAIAEHIGGSVEGFAQLMNEKAAELGCSHTHFVTPNGLDGEDAGGTHHTTAVELARIAAYAIQNERFVEIINTESYTFSEVNGKRTFSVYNKDAFLHMYNGAFGIKTGFTGQAGYCFVGAVKQDDRTFISVVLGSGWPPNKTYKWKDTKKLMDFGTQNYYRKQLYAYDGDYKSIAVTDGVKEYVETYTAGEVSMLYSIYDETRVVYQMAESIEAPVYKGQKVGQVNVYVNDELYGCFEITAKCEVRKIDFSYCLDKILKFFLL